MIQLVIFLIGLSAYLGLFAFFEARMGSFEARISIPNDVLFRNLDGEAVLLNLQSGKYFGLDPIGTRIWNLLIEFGTLPATYQTLLNEYDVDAQRLEADLLTLVDNLAAHGLIQLHSPWAENEI